MKLRNVFVLSLVLVIAFGLSGCAKVKKSGMATGGTGSEGEDFPDPNLDPDEADPYASSEGASPGGVEQGSDSSTGGGSFSTSSAGTQASSNTEEGDSEDCEFPDTPNGDSRCLRTGGEPGDITSGFYHIWTCVNGDWANPTPCGGEQICNEAATDCISICQGECFAVGCGEGYTPASEGQEYCIDKNPLKRACCVEDTS